MIRFLRKPCVRVGLFAWAWAASAVLGGAFATGCAKKLTAEAIEQSPAAITQKGKLGSSTWIVTPEGNVSASLKDPAGLPISQTVTGQVTFAGPGGAPTSVPVQADPSTGILTAVGPKLEADVTPVSYALVVNGKPWNGSIDVPKAGTEDLVATGKLQTAAPIGRVGPNGGVVQVVGPDRIEVVANKSTGDVRAYVLDSDDKPMDPGDRKITLALQGEAPEVLVLAPEPQGHFVVGHLRSRLDPAHVTLAVNARGTTHACLVGWSPGSVVVVGPEAPRVHLLAVDAWPGEVDVRAGHGRHHGAEVVVGGSGFVEEPPGVVIQGAVGLPAPGVMVGAPGLAVAPPGLPVPPGLPAPGVAVRGANVVVGGPAVVVGGNVSAGAHGHAAVHAGRPGH